MKYIVTGTSSGPYGCETRPTQASFKDFGEGEYALRRGDGSISKRIIVTVNRNGNLKVEGLSPDGLEGISTIVLNRMVRAYAPIVKAWPRSASAKDYRKVVDEVQARAALVGTVESKATRKPKSVKPVEAEAEMEASEPEVEVVTDSATGEEIEVERVALVTS